MMGTQMKMGILSIVFGVLLLIVGLVMSGLIIDNVNKQGGKIGCFDADDIIIKPAHGPNTTEIPADSATPWPAVTNSAAVPSKVSSAYTGANVVGKVCGSSVTNAAEATGNRAAVAAFTSPTCSSSSARCGTIRYTLKVFGADSLNNIMTMVYWIVLIGIALGLVGAGGMSIRGAYS